MINQQGPMSTRQLFKYDTVMRIIRTLREAGHRTLLVGGCVRDLLLGRHAKDYDVVTAARPEEVKALFKHTVDVGEKFGVIKVILSGQEVEVATFRTDAGYEDGRRPTAVKYADAYADAFRRDFTINGLFYDPVEGRVIDYVDGRSDIEARLVRAIGNPAVRFAEDHLRMLRAVRFASALGFTIETETLKALKANVEKIRLVSGERIRTELEAMLVDPSRRAAVELMYDTGLLVEILPEVAATKGVKQGKREHPEGDVWQHTLLAIGYLEEPSFELAMAVLLHDVGKPPTAHRRGRYLFAGHERVGEDMARQIAGRLKLSKRETEHIAFLVRYHMILKDVKQMKKSTLKRILGHELFEDLAEVHRVDALASNGDLSNYEFAMDAKDELSREQIKPTPLLTGHDLVAMGLAPGPKIGRILRRIYTAQLEERVATRQEALDLARKLAAEFATQ